MQTSVALVSHPICIGGTSLSFLPNYACRQFQKETFLGSRANKDTDDEWISAEIAEVIQNDVDEDEEEDWLPDKEKARRKREKAQQVQSYQSASFATKSTKNRPQAANAVAADATSTSSSSYQKASAYTEEEEDVIRAMGGKTKKSSIKREPGFLGDSTLEEIATDYSVPVCYLADVLCTWGVPVPINVHDRLGDLVTGEQAFAILEAVNSLDVAALHDRYSNQSLMNLCADWNIDLNEAFQMAMKEGWNLPFGVHTVLRVEQEDELLRILGGLGY
jgi:hypothetical protein